MKKNAECVEAFLEAVSVAGSRANLARMINLSQERLCSWERGRRPIPLSRAIDIERKTGVRVERLCVSLRDEIMYLRQNP